LQKADDGVADTCQAEFGGIDVVKGYPAGIGSIVGSMDGR
jgi:hypothetical protein